MDEMRAGGLDQNMPPVPNDMHLGARAEMACRVGPVAKMLYGIHHLQLLCDERVAQPPGPLDPFIHPVQDLGESHQ